MSESLSRLIAAEIATPVPTPVAAFAEHLWRDGAVAILFYGSGLWKAIDPDTMLDFYVLCDDLAAYGLPPLSRLAAHLLPPNVYYAEIVLEERTWRAKAAVMRLDDFRRAARGESGEAQIWARFCQPCRVVKTRDAAAARQVADALEDAVACFCRETRALHPDLATPRDFWTAGFAATYGYEWRSERAGRGAAIFDAQPEAFTARLAATGGPGIAGNAWARLRRRQRRGKRFHALRLAKAAFTFRGGLDYLLWKIARHSGVRMEATPFQRRHPLLGGWTLLWRLWRRGGFH